ncbi:DUF4136 domain-containing protein [Vibrio rotiferianus]|uniref:DUF4136 domain-containing protein n=1 Tax=Vibrio rotiferianus TaxID=190895 RepID=UPI0028952ED6|nr:conserved exported hypothetical protein [Vibrio rotiferianus]CAH1591754.1 conserved exported hypothetical protein [Vibrio rotiferianus]
MLKRAIGASLLALMLGACTTVSTDVDKQADFTRYKTFDFGEKGSTPMSLDARRIEEAIEGQLQSKGLSMVEAGGDLYIHHDIQQESELVSSGTSFGVGYGWNSFGVAVSSPERYRERKYGNLVVELVDTKANQVVWKAISKRKLTESMSTEKREEFISEEVQKMFELYPPKEQ